MAEAGVFDYARVQRTLGRALPDAGPVVVVGVDDVSRAYWVLTTSYLLVLVDDAVVHQLALEGVNGDVTTDATGVTVRVRESGPVVVGTFRTRTKLTDRLAELLADDD